MLANYLRNEYPQTVAVILSRISPDHAARVLAILPDDFAVDVVNRMLKMETVQKEALEHIEETLRNEFVSTLSQTTRRDPHELMAEIFNAFDRQTESRFLVGARRASTVSPQAHPRAHVHLRGSRQARSRPRADPDAPGRQGHARARRSKAPPKPMRTFFFANMSSRAAKILQDDMSAMGPIRLKDVDEAQNKMRQISPRISPTRARS